MFSTKILKKWTSTLFLMTLAFVSYTPDIFAQAEFRIDPLPATGTGVTNNVGDNIYRTGRLSVGSQAPNGLPPDTKLHVKGRFSQEFSGNIGSFSNSDKWASLGESFAPNPSFTKIYGLFSQWGGTGLVTGVKDAPGLVAINNPVAVKKALVGWSGTNARLDFDWIDGNLISRTRMVIQANGNVAIGTTNAANYKFFVNGTTGCSLGFWSGSDKRYKKDIKKIDSALDKIQALDGMTYKFKNDEVNGFDFTQAKDINHLGFLAQDVEKVFPELVRKDEAGYYAVNYDGFIPVLVEGMKEQQNTVDAQAETIQEQASTIVTQANEIDELKTRMNRLETLLNDLAANKTERGDNIAIKNTAVLGQNAANPFSDKTTIAYELPSTINNASLVIYDLGGKEVESYPITTTRGSVTVYATNLENGTYVYALVANGQTLAQQKMVVQK